VHEILKPHVTEERLAILKLLSEHDNLSIDDIASLMQKDRNTVYRQISSLIRMRLVNQRGRLYELTDLGRMLV